MSEIILTNETFSQEVLHSSVPVLVDFWAPWCGPCRTQGPIIEELAKEIDPIKFKVAKLNVDESQPLAGQYNVMSIPSLLIFKGGQVVNQFVGVQNKETLKAALEQA